MYYLMCLLILSPFLVVYEYFKMSFFTWTEQMNSLPSDIGHKLP